MVISAIVILIAICLLTTVVLASVMSNFWSRGTQVVDTPVTITVGPGDTYLPDWEIKAIRGTLYEATLILTSEVNTTVILRCNIAGNVTDVTDVFITVYYDDSWQGFPVTLTDEGMTCYMTVPIILTNDAPTALPMQIMFNKQGYFVTTLIAESGGLGYPLVPVNG